jgi:30S ribosome assembly GTPase
MIKCVGCGAIIQSEEPNKIGYTPSKTLIERTDQLYCHRCYRLRHYGEYKSVALEENDFFQKVQSIADVNCLVLFMIDIMDVYGSFMNGVSRIVGGNDIILVANKIDLLPKGIKTGKIIHWLKKYASDQGLKVKDFVTLSAKFGHHMEDGLDKIRRFANGRDVYVVGATNTGKSTFINQLIKSYSKETDDIITVSKFAGTTLDFIEIPLGRNNSIIDTPGLINKRQVGHYLTKPSLEVITPKTTIKPRVYQLEEKQTLFFGGMVRFDFIGGEPTSFVCYFSNLLYIHRTKLERASEVYDRLKGKELSPPVEDEMSNLGKMVRRSFKIPTTGEYDIVISGLGFVHIKGNDLQIDVYLYERMDVMIRQALI